MKTICQSPCDVYEKHSTDADHVTIMYLGLDAAVRPEWERWNILPTDAQEDRHQPRGRSHHYLQNPVPVHIPKHWRLPVIQDSSFDMVQCMSCSRHPDGDPRDFQSSLSVQRLPSLLLPLPLWFPVKAASLNKAAQRREDSILDRQACGNWTPRCQDHSRAGASPG